MIWDQNRYIADCLLSVSAREYREDPGVAPRTHRVIQSDAVAAFLADFGIQFSGPVDKRSAPELKWSLLRLILSITSALPRWCPREASDSPRPPSDRGFLSQPRKC